MNIQDSFGLMPVNNFKFDSNKANKNKLIDIINKSSELSKPEKLKLTKVVNSKKYESVMDRFNFKTSKDSNYLAPSNDIELLNNLTLLINNYPKSLLASDLSVRSKRELPLNDDSNNVYEKLKMEKNRIIHDLKLQVDDGTHMALLLQLEAALDLYRPRTVVPVTIMIENVINKDSPDVFLDAAKNNKELPTVLTKTIIYNQAEPFQKLLESQDIYVQKEGGFVLVLPKGSDPASLGFNTLKNFEKWEKPLSEIPPTPLNFSEDVTQLLLKNQEDRTFDRLISLQGHGSSPSADLGVEEGQVAGLPVNELQKGLQVLQKNNMQFLHIFSCYSGGINSTKLHTPEGVTPCPILVESSLDIPAFSSTGGYKDFFGKVEELLYKSDQRQPKLASQLLQSDLLLIAKKTPLHQTKNLNNYLNSLATTLLPTSVSDVPKVSYSLPTLDKVLDLKSEIKRQGKEILVLPHLKTVLFSFPIVEGKLRIQGKELLLASRGGTSQHLIHELEAPNCDIKEIAKTLFESTMGFPSPAKKAYFFGKVTCLYNGKLTELENCMLKKSDKESLLLFKVKGEERFVCMNYCEESDFYDDTRMFVPKNQTTALSLNEIKLLIYDTLEETKASNETLLQSGTTFNKDILSNFNHIFWSNEEEKVDLKEMKRNFINATDHLSEGEVIQLVSRFPILIKYLGEKWKENKNILMGAIESYPAVLEVTDNKTLRELLQFLPPDKTYLAYTSLAAREDEETVTAFLNHNPFNIDHCSKKMKNNENVMLNAVRKSGMFFPLASEELKENEKFLGECLKIAPDTLKHMSVKARNLLSKDNNSS